MFPEPPPTKLSAAVILFERPPPITFQLPPEPVLSQPPPMTE